MLNGSPRRWRCPKGNAGPLLPRLWRASPRFLAGWAELGDLGRDTMERYAAYRVGYHRGLDTLRANGWRGSGYVRWAEPTNHGFLRALRGLGAMAAEIGETDEAERITLFLLQLDPTGIPPLTDRRLTD